jgi:hypothetical protein
MTRLQKIRRREERIVPIQGVHQGQVIPVEVHGRCEVGKSILNLLTKLVLGEQTILTTGCLDRHSLEDGLESIEFTRESDNRVSTREKAPSGRDHEGWKQLVLWAGIVQDVERRVS